MGRFDWAARSTYHDPIEKRLHSAREAAPAVGFSWLETIYIVLWFIFEKGLAATLERITAIIDETVRNDRLDGYTPGRKPVV
jgi:hypothetical protein